MDNETPFPSEQRPDRPGHLFNPDDVAAPPAEPPRRRGQLRDRDSSETAYRLKIIGWCAYGSVLFGLGAGFYGSRRDPPHPFIFGIIGYLCGFAITYSISQFLASRAGSGAAALFFPSGRSTPGDRQYSLAQSFVARGMYERAAEEYAKSADQYPADPEPALRLARLYRDELRRYPDAIRWFRRVCDMPDVAPATEVMAMRELIEVCTHRIGDPAMAAPYLARLAARHPDTPAGQWARVELADVKGRIPR